MQGYLVTKTFVKTVKHTSFSLGAALLLILVLWPVIANFISDIEYKKFIKNIGFIPSNLSMVKPYYIGTDEKGNSYNIQAKKGYPYTQKNTNINNLNTKNARFFKLESINAHYQQVQNGLFNVSAENGIYDYKENTLKLEGNVFVKNDKGYNVKMNKAVLDLNKGTLIAQNGFSANGEKGSIDATSATADKKNEKIYFQGGVKVKLNLSKPTQDN